jgi:Ran GTPase-activating protein (RanGAP) involved in mRNA processing and transport
MAGPHYGQSCACTLPVPVRPSTARYPRPPPIRAVTSDATPPPPPPSKSLLPAPEYDAALPAGHAVRLFRRRCEDQRLGWSEEREARFVEVVRRRCRDRRLGLRELSLGVRCAGEVVRAVAEAQSFTGLDLCGNALGDAGAAAIGGMLSRDRDLVWLDLGSNNIGPAGASMLFEGLHGNETLTSLNLSGPGGVNRNHIGPAGAEALAAALRANRTLAELHLSLNSLGEPGLAVLSPALAKHASLTHLDLSSNALTAEALAHLAAHLGPSSRIHSLDLSRNALTSAGAEHVARIISRAARLRNLSLSRCQIGHEGGEEIAAALPGTQLHRLDLSGNRDLGARAFAAVCAAVGAHGGALQWLSFARCGISGVSGSAGAPGGAKTASSSLAAAATTAADAAADAEAIASAGPKLRTNTKLVHFDVSGNPLGDRGAAALARWLPAKGCSLESINFSDCAIGDPAAVALAAAIQRNTSLVRVLLAGNQIAGAGGDALARAVAASVGITAVDTARNSVPYAAHRALVIALEANRKREHEGRAVRLEREAVTLRECEVQLGEARDDLRSERDMAARAEADIGDVRARGDREIEALAAAGDDLQRRVDEMMDEKDAIEQRGMSLVKELAKYRSEMEIKCTTLAQSQQREQDKKREIEKAGTCDFFF